MNVSPLILLAGIMALISGFSTFALLPNAMRSLLQQQETGKISAVEVSKKKRLLVVIGACQLIVGSGLLVSYSLHLY